MKYLGHWTFSAFRIGNGSKAFGGSFWWNSQRFGLEFTVWDLEVQVMRERRWK